MCHPPRQGALQVLYCIVLYCIVLYIYWISLRPATGISSAVQWSRCTCCHLATSSRRQLYVRPQHPPSPCVCYSSHLVKHISSSIASQLSGSSENWDLRSQDPGINIREKEAKPLPRDLQNALYQLKCCPTLVQITQTDHVSAWGAFSATATCSTFYSATCIILYTHHCNRFKYHTASMRCSVSHTCNAEVSCTCCCCQLGRNCYQQSLTTTNVVDDIAHSSASAL